MNRGGGSLQRNGAAIINSNGSKTSNSNTNPMTLLRNFALVNQSNNS